MFFLQILLLTCGKRLESLTWKGPRKSNLQLLWRTSRKPNFFTLLESASEVQLGDLLENPTFWPFWTAPRKCTLESASKIQHVFPTNFVIDLWQTSRMSDLERTSKVQFTTFLEISAKIQLFGPFGERLGSPTWRSPQKSNFLALLKNASKVKLGDRLENPTFWLFWRAPRKSNLENFSKIQLFDPFGERLGSPI